MGFFGKKKKYSPQFGGRSLKEISYKGVPGNGNGIYIGTRNKGTL